MIIPCYKNDKNSIKATYHSIYATVIFLLLIFMKCRMDHIMGNFKINDILFFVKKSPHKCRLFDHQYFDYSRNLTVTPDFTFLPKSLASQLVKRIQPCEAVLEMVDGFGVP